MKIILAVIAVGLLAVHVGEVGWFLIGLAAFIGGVVAVDRGKL